MEAVGSVSCQTTLVIGVGNGMTIREIERATDLLAGCLIGSELLVFEKIGSTMDEARDRAVHGASEVTVVAAEEQ